MKKLSLLAITALTISFASCKKDYTCTCVYQGGGSSTEKIIGVSKKAAKANCVSTINDGYTTTCTLSK